MKQKVTFYYLKYALFFIMLYFFIFNPPFSFLPLSPKFGLYLLVFPYFLKRKFHRYFGYFKGIFFAIAAIVVFCFLREIEMTKSEFFILNFTMFFEYLLIPLFLIMFYESFAEDKDMVLDIVKVGIFASFFTIGMIFLPALGDFIRYQLLKTDDFTENVAERTFGLAESLTFSYGIVQGIMASLILFYSKQNKKLLLFLPVLIICIMFNARVGFSALIVGVGFYYAYNFKILNILATVIVLFSLFFIVTETSLFEKQKETIEWGLDFFTQSSDFLSGKKSDDNTFDTLFGDMFILPDTEEAWLIGNGINIFGRTSGGTSDIGYILQLYYGGIIYLALLFLIVLALFKKVKGLPKKEFFIGSSFLVTIILCNIKGNVFIPIGTMRLIILLVMWFVISNKNKLSLRTNE